MKVEVSILPTLSGIYCDSADRKYRSSLSERRETPVIQKIPEREISYYSPDHICNMPVVSDLFRATNYAQ